jgi:hypothetical protein
MTDAHAEQVDPSDPRLCDLGDAPAVTSCVRCRRPLCARHVVRKRALARFTLGAFFDDRRPRCEDCYAIRFWSACVGACVLFGVVGALASAVEGDVPGGLAMLGLAAVWGAVSMSRMRSFERRRIVDDRLREGRDRRAAAPREQRGRRDRRVRAIAVWIAIGSSAVLALQVMTGTGIAASVAVVAASVAVVVGVIGVVRRRRAGGGA